MLCEDIYAPFLDINLGCDYPYWPDVFTLCPDAALFVQFCQRLANVAIGTIYVAALHTLESYPLGTYLSDDLRDWSDGRT